MLIGCSRPVGPVTPKTLSEFKVGWVWPRSVSGARWLSSRCFAAGERHCFTAAGNTLGGRLPGVKGEWPMTGTWRRGEETAGQRWRVIPPRPAPRLPGRRSLRTTLAIDAGRVAGRTSRWLGLGHGAVIGGRVAMRIQPRALPLLTRGMDVVVVTGTNGKTTTTRMIAEAIRSRGDAVSNATGANMLDGHVAALMTDGPASYAALEVDELHLVRLTVEFEPAVIVLLNLSRDQLDRVGEIRTVESSLRHALEKVPATHVVANRDDPNIVSIAADHPSVTWISGGARWTDDALNCPRCGAFLPDAQANWRCDCGLSCPDADWVVTDEGLFGPDGARDEITLALPGRVNRLNAAFALAAALEVGCERDAALARIAAIENASGRYSQVLLEGRQARLLLAKNPASWVEMLDLVSEHQRPLVLAVNSREADGHDVSWLWDIGFERLCGRTVRVTGDRALDLAVRLHYGGVQCVVHARAEDALADVDDHIPEVIANYTAFRDLFARSVPR